MCQGNGPFGARYGITRYHRCWGYVARRHLANNRITEERRNCNLDADRWQGWNGSVHSHINGTQAGHPRNVCDQGNRGLLGALEWTQSIWIVDQQCTGYWWNITESCFGVSTRKFSQCRLCCTSGCLLQVFTNSEGFSHRSYQGIHSKEYPFYWWRWKWCSDDPGGWCGCWYSR